MRLTPLRTFRRSTNDTFRLDSPEGTFLVKRYVGPDAAERCTRERTTVELWRRHGARVPGLRDFEHPDLRGVPHLVMEYLDGPTLQEWLREAPVSVSDKLDRLGALFAENWRRHHTALQLGEPRLVHYDPNTSNLLLAGSDLVFIDFENPSRELPLPEAISIEMAKLCRWAGRDLGPTHLPALMTRLVAAYRERPDLLRRIVDRTCSRPWQPFHRWCDRRKKQKHPGDVTKYDLADTLVKLL